MEVDSGNPRYCTIDTLSSALSANHAGDTAIAVYYGSSLSTLTPVARNNDAYEAQLSEATFVAQPGTTYYIAVDCAPATAGVVRFRLRELILEDAEWQGVLQPADPAQSLPGIVSLKTTRSGALSGQLTIGAKKFPFKGSWGANGRFRVVFPQLSKSGTVLALPIELIIDGAGTSLGLYTQLILPNQSIAGGLGRVTPFSASNASPERGAYSLVILDNDTIGSGGIRYTVSPTGLVKGAGFMGDGQPIIFGSRLTEPFSSDIRQFAIHLPLFSGAGCLNGYIYCSPVESGSFFMNYLRPPQSGAAFYPLGFRMEVDARGALYTRPRPGQRVLGLLDPAGVGRLEFAHTPNEFTGFMESLTLGANNQFVFTNPAIRKPRMKIDLATGMISGSINEPPGRTRKLRGIVARFGDMPVAFGLCTGTTRTGSFGIFQ